MEKDRFWSIVDATRLPRPSHRGDIDCGERNKRYKAAMDSLSLREIQGFRRAFEERMRQAYRWDLVAAAVLIRDGCRLCYFRDFLAWLISQGREAFEAALRDPDSLADNAEVKADASCAYPAFWSIPFTVYRERTGRDLPKIALPARPAGKKLPEEPRELAQQFPRLYKTCFREHWEEVLVESEHTVSPALAVDVPPMSEKRFWALIDKSRERAKEKKLRRGEDFIDRHIKELTQMLRELSAGELIAFDRRFDFYHALAYRWDLWAIAYWLHAGCSDDGFNDFRSCLISLGKATFFRALKDPDSLAEVVGRRDAPYLQAEGFQYVASTVYKEKTKEEMPEGKTYRPAKPAGRRIDHDNEAVMRRHFPKTVAKFPDMGD